MNKAYSKLEKQEKLSKINPIYRKDDKIYAPIFYIYQFGAKARKHMSSELIILGRWIFSTGERVTRLAARPVMR